MASTTLTGNTDYQAWLKEIKQRVVSARVQAAVAANREMILFYWELGAQIAEKQANSQWGDKLIPQLSADLKKAFPELRGFSESNLKYCLRFYLFFANAVGSSETPFGQQPVDQIPWGHSILIFTKCASVDEASFYIAQTIEQGWSRDVLALHLKSRLYNRAAKSVTNFSSTLPAPQSDLAQQTLKDPYIFDFMAMTAPYNERDVERQLSRHITQFLLELGDMNKPMGVSEYTLVETLPDNLKGAMPTVEEIEQDLKQLKAEDDEHE